MIRLLLTMVFFVLPSVALSVKGYSVADDSITLTDHFVEIDLETGEYTSKGQIQDPFIGIEGLAMSPAGVLYGADDNTKTLVQIHSQKTQALAVGNLIDNLGFGGSSDSYDFGMSFACDKQLYMVTKANQGLYNVNYQTGKATLIGTTGHNFTSLAAWGDDMYAVASADYTLYKIDPKTAEATAVGNMGNLGGGIELSGSGLAFDESGQLWMVINLRLSDPLNPYPSRIFKINTQTGEATQIAETLVGIESLAIAPPGGCSDAPGDPVEVPTSNYLTLFYLSILLIFFAWFKLQPLRSER